MSSFSLRKQDPVLFTGLVAIALSLVIFVLADRSQVSIGGNKAGAFVLHFLIAVNYFIVLIGSKRLRMGQNGFFPFLLFFLLLLISAYALNRQLRLFDLSTIWFCIVLVLVSGNYIAIGLFTGMPDWIRYLTFGIACISICFFAFLSMSRIPLTND